MYTLYLLGALVVLYLSKQSLVYQLSHLVWRSGGTKKFVIILWSIIFLPGTIIHELSHFFMAILVGARTGKVEIFPRSLDSDTDTFVLGSVQTQKLNIVQGVLVGLAPILSGLVLVFWLSGLIFTSYNQLTSYSIVIGYLFFTVINSMFPSRSDLNHVIPAVITLTLLFLLLFFSGVNISLDLNDLAYRLVSPLLSGIWLAIVINIIISILIYLVKKIVFR